MKTYTAKRIENLAAYDIVVDDGLLETVVGVIGFDPFEVGGWYYVHVEGYEWLTHYVPFNLKTEDVREALAVVRKGLEAADADEEAA